MTTSTRIAIALIATMTLTMVPAGWAADDETFEVNSPVKTLQRSMLAGAGGSKIDEPMKTGYVAVGQARSFICRLAGLEGAACNNDTRTTILHVLRWGDAEHKKVKAKQWYVFDPTGKSRTGFSLQSPQAQFQGDFIGGRTEFRFLYVHLNFAENQNESTTQSADGTTVLVHPKSFAYKIAIAQQESPLRSDAETLLQILGLAGAAPAAADPIVGYYSVFVFDSEYKTSKITISATVNAGEPKEGAKEDPKDPKAVTKANDLDSKSYNNIPRQWIGLSFAVPLQSYEDLEVSESAGRLVPKAIKRENVYAAVNFYLPGVNRGQTHFRLLPHPFFAMPIKGQPLRHTMTGIAMGFRWIEPFWGVVFNKQPVKGTDGTVAGDRWVRKGIWGINVSVSAVRDALAKK
jgi:hypothetical protein